MVRPGIDLPSCITSNGPRVPVDFQVALRPLFYQARTGLADISEHAVVRIDTGVAIAVVSDCRPLILHQRLLDGILTTAARLELGVMPHGAFLDRGGARMRAIITFPALSERVRKTERVCPCIMVENSYNRVGLIRLYAGAVGCGCNTPAVRGGGVFTWSQIRIDSGELSEKPSEQQIEEAIHAFPSIVRAYRIWAERPLDREGMDCILEGLRSGTKMRIWRRISDEHATTVYDAYKAAIHHATRCMPSVHSAFTLVQHLNAGFQRVFRSR